jgi:serine/threonine-protein kinase
MTLPEDTILENRYRIDRLLAHGGMGAIYRGFDTNLSMPVAIKENFFQTPQSIRQFQQEALILARLHHPSLPRVIQHFSYEGQQYLVMDFIEGEDLWEIVKKQKRPLEEAQGLTYITQICEAVVYLHKQNPPIIHRDIKPQNIKITPDNRAVLVDFGIAKIVEVDSRTRTGAQAVTPGFSPPEQYSRVGTTPASDIYSLGATLYAILTGKKPPDSISLLVNLANFEPPNAINEAISNRTSQTIMHAMRPQPEDRPPSVEVWKKELQASLNSLNASKDNKDNKDNKEETLLPGTILAAEKPEKRRSVATPTLWLVDSNGVGHGLGSNVLVMGRHSNADVFIDDKNVSRQHALIRAERQRCMVMDNGSANGTFINDQRLGLEWHVLNQGDVLRIGSATFNVSPSEPSQTASPAIPPAVNDEDEVRTRFKPVQRAPAAIPSPLPESEPVTPSAKPFQAKQSAAPSSVGVETTPPAKARRNILPIIIAMVVLLGALGAAAFFLLAANTSSSNATATATAQEALIVAQTETADARALEAEVTGTASAVAAEATQQAADEAAAPAAARAAESATLATSIPTDTPPPTEVPPTATPKPTNTPAKAAATATGRPPTTTPTPATANTPAAVAAGPTLIPLESDISIPQIGVREVIDVDINLKNPREVYVLVKADGIYKSTNGGDGPWAKMELDGSAITALVIDPNNPARLFAPTWNAVLRSDDGGNSWKAFGNGLSNSNRAVDTVAIDPVDPNNLYAGIGATLVVSTNGGESWISEGFANGLAQGRITGVAVDPFNHDVVLVGGEFGSIYRSNDSGRNFIQLDFSTGKGMYSLVAHPTQKDVYLAGINSFDAGIVKTENGADFSSSSNGLVFGGADSAYSAITFAPSNPNIIYTGSGYESDQNAKGIFKTTNGGKDWDKFSNGLSTNPATGQPHYVKSIAVHPTNPDILLAATGGGLFKSTDGGRNWVIK